MTCGLDGGIISERNSPLADGLSLTAGVNSYYEETRSDYYLMWLNASNLALHFGYAGDRARQHHLALENTNRVLAKLADIRTGDRVLDAGCGLGGSGCWLAKYLGAEVVGITNVTRQAEEARQIVERKRLSDRVTIECQDYTDTRFPDGAFDVVWSLESLCHAPRKEKFYREAMRVLRPGGRLVVADYIRSTRDNSVEHQDIIREWLKGWAMPDIATRNEHISYASSAGFMDVQIDDYTDQMIDSSRRLYTLARIAGPIDLLLFALKLRSAVQHGNVVASRRQYEALQKGLWFYGVLTANKK